MTIVKELNNLSKKVTGKEGVATTDAQAVKFIADNYEGGGSYVLPTASADTLGGVKVGDNLSIDANGVLSASGGGSSEYAIIDLEAVADAWWSAETPKILKYDLSSEEYNTLIEAIEEAITNNQSLMAKFNGSLLPVGNLSYTNDGSVYGSFSATSVGIVYNSSSSADLTLDYLFGNLGSNASESYIMLIDETNTITNS